MLTALAEDAIVLIDAPPLLPVTDAAVLSRAADGAIVVIRTGRTTQEQVGQSLGNLEKVKGRVLGAVLNYVPIRGTDAYSYYGTYTSASVLAAVVDPQLVAVPNVDEPERVLESHARWA
jgi:Mrp family chromosome partitioning ATPase